MKILRPIFLITLFLIVSAAAEPPAAAPTAETAAAAGGVEFIRANCETTQYPERCYSSLNGYASVVQRDPARLAAVAIGVSLSRATVMSVYVANLSREAAEPRAASAVRDCFSVFRDAVGLIRGSMKQMRRRSAAGGEELRFQMSNVQTWMSAALTNEETCTDGFEGVSDGQLKAEVCDRTAEVKEVTSNALALVNSYVNKVVVP